jgi:lipopolysaccharide transport system permease protein
MTFGSAASPFAVFTGFWEHRRLIFRLAVREIEARYRGSILGIAWSVLTPLLMLGVYTFVFSVIFQARWDVHVGSRVDFAFVLYAGMIVFSLFAECANRAPGLLLENVAYIKRVVFPIEILPWVTILSSLFNAAVGVAVLLVGYTLLSGPPPWTAVLVPILLLPVVLLSVGTSWLFSALGIYIRDLRQIVTVATTALLFLSPIFYPVTALPEHLRPFLYLNPLTFIIEQVRTVLVWGTLPAWFALLKYSALSWLVAWIGLLWFAGTRRGFADVV